MDASIVASLIQAGSSAASTGVSAARGKKSRKWATAENEKSREFQREQYHQSLSDAKKWYETYESPSALRRQYAEAGYSPYAAIGQQAGSQQVVGTPMDSGDPNAGQHGFDIEEQAYNNIGGSIDAAIAQYLNYKSAEANIEKTKADARKSNLESDAQEMNNIYMSGVGANGQNMFSTIQDLHQASMKADIDLKTAQKSLAESGVKVNDEQAKLIVENTKKVKHEIENLIASTKYLDGQSKMLALQMGYQKIVNNFADKNAELGLPPDSPWYAKMLGDWVEKGLNYANNTLGLDLGEKVGNLIGDPNGTDDYGLFGMYRRYKRKHSN